MDEQDAIHSTRFSRTAALAGAGAKVGLNYLKYYGRRALASEAGAKALETTLHEENASQVFKTFSQLKGAPLKLAQMLSIDKNILPAAYLKSFAQAQYSTPPLSYPLVVRTFRREFGREPLDLFDEFTRQAASGASIGQVHRAARGVHQFAVKVQYPGVAESLQNDLRVVKPIALQVLGLRESDVAEYFEEVKARLLEETDYALELQRSQQLAHDCAGVPHIRFPAMYPELSSARVLTMDWVEGEALDRFADGPASQAERDQVGQALWDFYDHQIHQLRLFHADPHPGNFLVRDGDVWVLDFGCTKALPEDVYRQQFRFLDPSLLDDATALARAMEELQLLLPQDGPVERAHLVRLFQDSVGQLALPFRHGFHDFGDPEYMAAIYRNGQANSEDKVLRKLRGRRGSPHSVYVNRAYFGLYSLLSRLRARVKTRLPDWLAPVGAA